MNRDRTSPVGVKLGRFAQWNWWLAAALPLQTGRRGEPSGDLGRTAGRAASHACGICKSR